MRQSGTRCALAAGVLVLAALPLSAMASTDTGSTPENITFSSVGSGGAELVTMGADGTHARRLTRHSAEVLAFTWGPDRRSLSYIDYDGTVWTASIATGHPNLLVRRFLRNTSNGIVGVGLAWSPDGRRLVGGGAVGLPVFDRRDGSLRNLRPKDGYDSDPAWSPDGRMIAFTADRHIRVVGADGSHARDLGFGKQPAWSPDGTAIVFSDDSCSTCSHDQLYVMAADGSSRTQLTNDACFNGAPTWAPRPDITFDRFCISGTNHQSSIDVIHPDGTGRVKVVACCGSPEWSADGNTLAAWQNGNIVLLDSSGAKPRALINPPPGSDYAPHWSPDHRKLAFYSSGLKILAGGKVRTLPVPNYDEPSSWAPDSRRLAAVAAGDIDIVDTDTGAVQKILDDRGAGDPSKCSPTWSPNGRWILYPQTEGGGIGLFDVRHMREAALRLRLSGNNPVWAPDGRRFAYESSDGCTSATKKSAVFIANADGSNQRRIARNASMPAWSRDGTKIAFVRIIGNSNREICVMNADGTRQRRLTHNPGPDIQPTWG